MIHWKGSTGQQKEINVHRIWTADGRTAVHQTDFSDIKISTPSGMLLCVGRQIATDVSNTVVLSHSRESSSRRHYLNSLTVKIKKLKSFETSMTNTNR